MATLYSKFSESEDKMLPYIIGGVTVVTVVTILWIACKLLKEFFSVEPDYFISQMHFVYNGEVKVMERDYDELPPGQYRVIARATERKEALVFFYADQGPNLLKAPCVKVNKVPEDILFAWRDGQLFQLPSAS